jgi:YHS domain-containing protein
MLFMVIGWIGRLLLILFIIRLIVSFFTGSARRARTNAPGSGAGAGGGRARGGRTEKIGAKLVRDPQCGTYVSEAAAIAASRGGETHHFCSTACRDAFLAAPKANAS